MDWKEPSTWAGAALVEAQGDRLKGKSLFATSIEISEPSSLTLEAA